MITTFPPATILERLNSQVTSWTGNRFEAAADTVLLTNGDAQPFDLGSIRFAERLLSLNIPAPWHLCFYGWWALADGDRDGDWYRLELDFDGWDDPTIEQMQTQVDAVLAGEQHQIDMFWLGVPVGFYLELDFDDIFLAALDSDRVAYDQFNVTLGPDLDVDQMQVIVDDTIRTRGPVPKIALEIAKAWQRTRDTTPASYANDTDSFVDWARFNETEWAALVIISGRTHGIENID